MDLNLELKNVTEEQIYSLANFLKRIDRNQRIYDACSENDEDQKRVKAMVLELRIQIDLVGYEVC